MPPTKPSPARSAFLAVLALLIAGGITIAVVDNGPDHDPAKPRRTVNVHLGGPGGKSVELPTSAQAVATAQAEQDAAGKDQAAHSDLHEQTDPQARPDRVAANAKITPPGQPVLPANPPLAASYVPGCRTLLVRNYSSRNGRPILLFVYHYTVSTDNGWSGVLGNVRWFDSPAAGASSTYITDRRAGACALTVAEASKAWAQAGFNSVALSLEVTANGTEPTYLAGRGRDRVLYLTIRAHRIYRLPYRHGAVSGCNVTRSGYVMHRDLGACGGGHVDVGRFTIDGIVRSAARLDTACGLLNLWRRHGRPGGERLQLARKRKRDLTRHHLGCRATGPAATRIYPAA